MKDTDWAYLAGLIDGEGCISTVHTNPRNGQFNAKIAIVNTDKTVLDWIVKTFAVGNVYPRRLRLPMKQSWRWQLAAGSSVSRILNGVYPYLIIKKDQAVLAIELCSRPAKRRQLEIYGALREAKR